jgi:membrane protease YdiL (CAAX protease family)
VAVKHKGSGSLRDLGLVPPRWVDAAMGGGFAIAGVIAVSIVAATLEQIDKNLVPGDRQDISEPIKSGAVLGILVLYLIAVVGAPFFEELYFRGLVQGTLTARWGSGIGIGVQAVLFGLVHLDPANGWANVGTFTIILVVGIMLGLIKHYSGRLPPGMFTHAGYNAILVTIGILAK